ncbi:hypothetical protein ACFLXI_05665 [Chloroflexota bacterium]
MIHKTIDIWEGFDFLSKSAVNPWPMLTAYVLSGEKVHGAVIDPFGRFRLGCIFIPWVIMVRRWELKRQPMKRGK